MNLLPMAEIKCMFVLWSFLEKMYENFVAAKETVLIREVERFK